MSTTPDDITSSGDEEPPKARRSTRKRAVKGSTSSDATTSVKKKKKMTNADDIVEPKKKAKGRPKKVKAVSSDDEGSDGEVEPKKMKAKARPKKAKAAPSDDDGSGSEVEPKKKKVKARPKKVKTVSSDNEGSDGEVESKKMKAKARPKKTKADVEEPTKEKKKPRKAAAADHQRLTERDELPKLWNAKEHEETSYTFKICSWNVAGLRALIRNHPETLEKMCREHDLDVLCLQETKLQEMHLDDKKLQIRDTVLQPDYDAYYSCSTAKKGYSGTAIFVKKRGSAAKESGKKQATLDNFFGDKKSKKKNEGKKDESADRVFDDEFATNLVPTEVSYKMGVDAHDQEGRLVIADFPLFSIINCYVPNSGQKLERLDYRTEQWDKDLLNFVQTNKSKTPCIWLGDLNVAHTNLEVWNDGAKHLSKQAGVTEQERQSFQHQLDTSGFKDAFRALHPTAKGCYSYWSQRAGNREPNKGLRLDYFCCAPALFDEEASKVVARDSYSLYDVYGSDHCPVVLELEIKK